MAWNKSFHLPAYIKLIVTRLLSNLQKDKAYHRKHKQYCLRHECLYRIECIILCFYYKIEPEPKLSVPCFVICSFDIVWINFLGG